MVSAAPFSRSISTMSLDAFVVEHALGVAQPAHDQPGIELGGGDDRLLDLVVHRRLFGGDKARAHVHAGGAERQRRDQTARIRHAARSHERYLQFIGGARQQDQVRHVVLARMAAAFEAVDADRIAADALGLERMPHRRAFVNDLDAGSLQRRQILLRASPGGLDDLDAAFDDGADVFRIGRGRKRRQERQVHAERLVGHVAAARDLARQQFRRLLRQPGDDAEPAGIRYRRCQFGEADIMHAALDDRMADAEHFGDGGAQTSLHGKARHEAGMTFQYVSGIFARRNAPAACGRAGCSGWLKRSIRGFTTRMSPAIARQSLPCSNACCRRRD